MVQMKLRRQPRRRPRPIIKIDEYSGNTGTAGAAIITVTPIAEVGVTGDQYHVETFQITGICRSSGGGQNMAVHTLRLWAPKTSAVFTDEDRGMRTRFILSNESGVPFVATFKNMNVRTGESLRFELINANETDATSTHYVSATAKLVYREID